ncbi:hypothetical protein GTQ99_23855, partial [Kineococcus sp. T13]|uniref:hypothetical protein n=1 Tax=Kineococcus vitellinus TaxID=2696565 RepID=UPI00196A3E3F
MPRSPYRPRDPALRARDLAARQLRATPRPRRGGPVRPGGEPGHPRGDRSEDWSDDESDEGLDDPLDEDDLEELDDDLLDDLLDDPLDDPGGRPSPVRRTRAGEVRRRLADRAPASLRAARWRIGPRAGAGALLVALVVAAGLGVLAWRT